MGGPEGPTPLPHSCDDAVVCKRRRRLKGMGAVYLQNGACIPPMTDDPIRQLKMIENEISKMGEAVILETVALDRAQVEKVAARFQADRG